MSFRKVRTLDEINKLVAENLAAKEEFKTGVSTQAAASAKAAKESAKALEPITKLLEAVVPGYKTELGEPPVKKSIGWFISTLSEELGRQGVKQEEIAKITSEINDKATDTNDVLQTTQEVLLKNGASAEDALRLNVLLYQDDPRAADLIEKVNAREVSDLQETLGEKIAERQRLLVELSDIYRDPEEREALSGLLDDTDDEIGKLDSLIFEKQKMANTLFEYSQNYDELKTIRDGFEADLSDINSKIANYNDALDNKVLTKRAVKSIKKKRGRLQGEKKRLEENIIDITDNMDDLLNGIAGADELDIELNTIEYERKRLISEYDALYDEYSRATDPARLQELELRGNEILSEIKVLDEEIAPVQEDIKRLSEPVSLKQETRGTIKPKSKPSLSPDNIFNLKATSIPKEYPITKTNREDIAIKAKSDISELGEPTRTQYISSLKKLVALFGFKKTADEEGRTSSTVFEELGLSSPLTKYESYSSALLGAVDELNKLKFGSGMRIGGMVRSIDPARLQLNKYSPYKIANDILGAFNINTKKLVNHRLLDVQHVGTGQYLFKDKKASDDLIRLLTRRYDGRIPYNKGAIADYKKIIKGSGLPLRRQNKKIQLILGPVKTMKNKHQYVDDSSDDGSIAIFTSPDEMVRRVNLIGGEIMAGNTNKRMRNEMVGIMDKLLNLGLVNKKGYKDLLTKYELYK